MEEIKGNKYGTHRVIEPQGVLTQAARKIDNDMSKVYSNEIVCDVISLNIDSASFTQIENEAGGDEEKNQSQDYGNRKRTWQNAKPRHRQRRNVYRGSFSRWQGLEKLRT